MAVAGLFAALVLIAGFPAASLLSQHHQLSAEAAQLSQLRQDNGQLARQENALNSKTEINRLARQDYQMVNKGQVLYDVLPPSGQRTATTVPGGTESGDPGNQPLVAPSNAPDMSPDPGLPQTPAPTTSSSTGGTGSGSGASSAAGSTGQPSSFWGRVANTLEFWQ